MDIWDFWRPAHWFPETGFRTLENWKSRVNWKRGNSKSVTVTRGILKINVRNKC